MDTAQRGANGRGGLKAKYVSGVLTFLDGATGDTVYTINPSTKAVAFAGAVTLTGESIAMAGDVRLDLSGATVAAANTDGGLVKAGTSGAPVTEDTANMKFMSFYFDNGATSGESVGLYCRQYVTGAAGSGIAGRFFQSVTNVAGQDCRGGHISLEFGATGKVTGLGVALETTLHVPTGAGAWAGGTYASLKVAINSDGSASDPVGATEVSFIRIDNQGDATGAADIDTDAVLFSLQGFTSGANDLLYDADEDAIAQPNGSLKIKIGSDVRYLYFWDGAVTP